MSLPAKCESQAAYIFGEVLLDEFPDGRSVIGGAPFNVAWNLHALGLSVELISAVGSDDAGAQIKRHIDQWGMSSRGLQRIEDLPTGRVTIELTEGQPVFEIIAPAAYDYIGLPERCAEWPRPNLVYHGTLALRRQSTRETFLRLVESLQCDRFVDLNIRQPWFDIELAELLLPGARWIKLNDAELGMLASAAPPQSADDVMDLVQRVRAIFGGQIYLVTCGDRGAYAIERETLAFAAAAEINSIQDTVGAGDAFSAAVIAHLAQHVSWPETLSVANRFAAKVCEIRGATTTDREFYRQIKQQLEAARRRNENQLENPETN